MSNMNDSRRRSVVSLSGLVLVLWLCGGCSVYGRTLHGSAEPTFAPVVFIPGHGGNQLEMRVDLEKELLENCKTTTNGWVRSWLNIWQLLPGSIECWVAYHKQSFDNVTKQYHNTPGVDIRVPGWGHTDTIEYVDPSVTAWMLGNVGAYAAPLIKQMKKWGYESGKNLRGAPYDFRYGSRTMPNFYQNLQALVEETYYTNHRRRVTLLSHSMGGVMAHYFLVHQTQEWKDKFIESMVTMNTPWKGTVVMLAAQISGYAWGHDTLDPLAFRGLQRSCESGAMLIPSPTAWAKDEILVVTPEKNYTSAMYGQLAKDMGHSAMSDMWEATKEVSGHNQNPGVDVFCVYSSGKPTPNTLVYGKGQFPDAQPRSISGDGDGTVNLRSARACRQWRDTDTHMVYTKEFPNMSHNGILRSDSLYSFLKTILL